VTYFTRIVILKSHRELDQIGSYSETSTGASGRTNRGGIDIKDGEHGKGGKSDHTNLIEAHSLSGKEVASNGYGETLKSILNESLDEVGKINTHGGSRSSFGSIGHSVYYCEAKIF
jgi:hypothetical protein